MGKQKLTPAEAVIYLAQNAKKPVHKTLQEGKYRAMGLRVDEEMQANGALSLIERFDPEGKLLVAELVIYKVSDDD